MHNCSLPFFWFFCPTVKNMVILTKSKIASIQASKNNPWCAEKCQSPTQTSICPLYRLRWLFGLSFWVGGSPIVLGHGEACKSGGIKWQCLIGSTLMANALVTQWKSLQQRNLQVDLLNLNLWQLKKPFLSVLHLASSPLVSLLRMMMLWTLVSFTSFTMPIMFGVTWNEIVAVSYELRLVRMILFGLLIKEGYKGCHNEWQCITVPHFIFLL